MDLVLKIYKSVFPLCLAYILMVYLKVDSMDWLDVLEVQDISTCYELITTTTKKKKIKRERIEETKVFGFLVDVCFVGE